MGQRVLKKIKELSIKNVELLLSKECKVIVVACNTATTNAIAYLRGHYDIPFVGIEPAIKPAALNSKTKIVGVLATKGTLSSALFHKTASLYGHDILKIEQEGEGIVELIESGNLYSVEMTRLLKNYLEPMIKANIDYLVLRLYSLFLFNSNIKGPSSKAHTHHRFWSISSKTSKINPPNKPPNKFSVHSRQKQIFHEWQSRGVDLFVGQSF